MHKKLKLLGILLFVLIILFLCLSIRPLKSSAPGVLITPAPAAASPLLHTDFREIVKGDTSKKQIIITVDAGFGSRSAEGLLNALSKHKIKASFFLVGKWIEEYPELTKRIAHDGHEIFNHSYNHDMYTTLTKEQIQADLEKMDGVLYKTVGLHTRPYYRAPSGDRNAKVNEAAAETGFQHVYWSVDPQDWRLDVSGETIKKRVLNGVEPGSIVLLHIADSATGEVADEIFTELEARGYKLVPLTEGL